MKNNYKKQFYKMYFKRAFLDFPKLIGLCLAAGLFAGLVLFIASKIYSDDAGKINAAYVIDEEDDSFRSAIKYLTQSANCKLKPSSEDKAMSDLYNKKVAAALLINNRDENGNTLTKDTILEKDSVTEYTVNDEMVTAESYDEIEKRYETIEKFW